MGKDDAKWLYGLICNILERLARITPTQFDDQVVALLKTDAAFEEFFNFLVRRGVVKEA